MKVIDPHLHLFDLTKGDYHWLKNESAPFWPDKHIINKNFSLDDAKITAPNIFSGFVHIEAGFDNANPWQEIEWLAKSINEIPFSAVAFIDITANTKEFNQQLTQLINYPCVVGCRYILDENASDELKKPQVLTNLKTLNEKGLSFDVQMSLEDINSVNELLKVLALLPTMSFIINHAGFPLAINDDHSTDTTSDFKQLIAWQNWQQAINLLSRFDNCSIKCSGWEMTERKYNSKSLEKVIAHCLTNFGDNRVMLASNFPLCLFSHENYDSYWREVIDCLDRLQHSKEQKSALLYNNALRVYKLSI